MSWILLSACITASAIVIAIVFRAAAIATEIDAKMERDLHDTFPPHSPNPATESIQEPAASHANR
jgi:hypothetical protein